MNKIAIIPARGGSKRIPRKNIVPVCGKPMLSYPLETALKSGLFEHVIVSTEDAEIKEIAQSFGARVIDRPAELATDTAFEIEVFAQVLDTLEEETGVRPAYFCMIYPTAILITLQDLEESFRLLEEGQGADSVMGVSAYPIHPYKALQAGEHDYLSMVYPKECKMRSQTYPHYVASNGTFCWLRTAAYDKDRNYYTERLRGYVMPAERAVDIDTPEDLKWAEMVKRFNAGERR